jgi:ubiquinol-cytochrome c reductase cytochrome c subunit
MKRLVIAAFVLVAALSSYAAPSPASPASAAQGREQRPANAAPAGNADTGKKLFVADGCYQCHGYEAQGSSATGPRLGPRPIAFTAFSRYVRQPTGQMPPYTAKVVSDADLANIYAFIQSRPEPAKDIPLLK